MDKLNGDETPGLPDDLSQALDETGARKGWETYPPPFRAAALAWIDAARTTAARSKRIDDVTRSARRGELPAALRD